MCRSALYSPFAPAFRSRECHTIRPCTVQSLSLTEADLRHYRTNLCIQRCQRAPGACSTNCRCSSSSESCEYPGGRANLYP